MSRRPSARRSSPRRLSPHRLALAALPLLALVACSSGGGEQEEGGGEVAAQGPPEAQTATVVGNKALEFVPSTITARPGTVAITMQIEGGVPHNLVFDEDTEGEDIETISEGSATSSFTFDQPGTYDFVCTLHPGMDGSVVVS